jgi:hypothetical protein
MDMTPILIVLIVFSAITAIIFGPSYLKSREKRDIQETVRHAIDKGQPLPSDLIDAMTRDVASKLPSRTKDLRRGVIWLASGIGIAAFSLITAMSNFGGNDFSHDAGGPLLGIAAIPATIGLAFIVLSFFNPNKE